MIYTADNSSLTSACQEFRKGVMAPDVALFWIIKLVFLFFFCSKAIINFALGLDLWMCIYAFTLADKHNTWWKNKKEMLLTLRTYLKRKNQAHDCRVNICNHRLVINDHSMALKWESNFLYVLCMHFFFLQMF